MKYISVCSGIEAASVAWHPLGWTPVAFSEIEPFPCKVLAHHYPTVPNRGDMTKFEEWPDESIDLLVGGTPCQSFSVAGKRAGLDDPRGQLMLAFLGIAERYRPQWLVWENVPGVLSSGGGRDFGTFLGALGELGYGWAFRVLDAQFFGVAQRRRRVFVVGCLGDWRRAASVLFESHCLRGNPAPRREARQSVAGTIAASSFVGGASGRPEGAAAGHFVAGKLTSNEVNPTREVVGTLNHSAGHAVPGNCAQDWNAGMLLPLTTYTTLGEGQTPVLAVRTANTSANGHGIAVDVPHTLDQAQGRAVGVFQDSEFGVRQYDSAGTLRAGRIPEHQMVIQPLASPVNLSGTQHASTENLSPVIGAKNPVPVAFGGDIARTLQARHDSSPCADRGMDVVAVAVRDISQTLTTNYGKQVDSSDTALGPNIVFPHMQVRRLTPTECERLQGFPDGYTNIPGAKDAPRYKALGNSMAVPCMAWIGRRIEECAALTRARGAE